MYTWVVIAFYLTMMFDVRLPWGHQNKKWLYCNVKPVVPGLWLVKVICVKRSIGFSFLQSLQNTRRDYLALFCGLMCMY